MVFFVLLELYSICENKWSYLKSGSNIRMGSNRRKFATSSSQPLPLNLFLPFLWVCIILLKDKYPHFGKEKKTSNYRGGYVLDQVCVYTVYVYLKKNRIKLSFHFSLSCELISACAMPYGLIFRVIELHNFHGEVVVGVTWGYKLAKCGATEPELNTSNELNECYRFYPFYFPFFLRFCSLPLDI